MGRARSSTQTHSPVSRLQYALVEPFYTVPNAGQPPEKAHEHARAQRQAIGSTVFVGVADVFAAAHSILQLLSVHSVARVSGSNPHEQAALDLAIAGLEAAGALFRWGTGCRTILSATPALSTCMAALACLGANQGSSESGGTPTGSKCSADTHLPAAWHAAVFKLAVERKHTYRDNRNTIAS